MSQQSFGIENHNNTEGEEDVKSISEMTIEEKQKQLDAFFNTDRLFGHLRKKKYTYFYPNIFIDNTCQFKQIITDVFKNLKLNIYKIDKNGTECAFNLRWITCDKEFDWNNFIDSGNYLVNKIRNFDQIIQDKIEFLDNFLHLCNTSQNDIYKNKVTTIPETYVVQFDIKNYETFEKKFVQRFRAGKYQPGQEWMLFNNFRKEKMENTGKIIQKLKILKKISVRDSYEPIEYFKQNQNDERYNQLHFNYSEHEKYILQEIMQNQFEMNSYSSIQVKCFIMIARAKPFLIYFNEGYIEERDLQQNIKTYDHEFFREFLKENRKFTSDILEQFYNRLKILSKFVGMSFIENLNKYENSFQFFELRFILDNKINPYFMDIQDVNSCEFNQFSTVFVETGVKKLLQVHNNLRHLEHDFFEGLDKYFVELFDESIILNVKKEQIREKIRKIIVHNDGKIKKDKLEKQLEEKMKKFGEIQIDYQEILQEIFLEYLNICECEQLAGIEKKKYKLKEKEQQENLENLFKKPKGNENDVDKLLKKKFKIYRKKPKKNVKKLEKKEEIQDLEEEEESEESEESEEEYLDATVLKLRAIKKEREKENNLVETVNKNKKKKKKELRYQLFKLKTREELREIKLKKKDEDGYTLPQKKFQQLKQQRFEALVDSLKNDVENWKQICEDEKLKIQKRVELSYYEEEEFEELQRYYDHPLVPELSLEEQIFEKFEFFFILKTKFQMLTKEEKIEREEKRRKKLIKYIEDQKHIFQGVLSGEFKVEKQIQSVEMDISISFSLNKQEIRALGDKIQEIILGKLMFFRGYWDQSSEIFQEDQTVIKYKYFKTAFRQLGIRINQIEVDQFLYYYANILNGQQQKQNWFIQYKQFFVEKKYPMIERKKVEHQKRMIYYARVMKLMILKLRQFLNSHTWSFQDFVQNINKEKQQQQVNQDDLWEIFRDVELFYRKSEIEVIFNMVQSEKNGNQLRQFSEIMRFLKNQLENSQDLKQNLIDKLIIDSIYYKIQKIVYDMEFGFEELFIFIRKQLKTEQKETINIKDLASSFSKQGIILYDLEYEILKYYHQDEINLDLLENCLSDLKYDHVIERKLRLQEEIMQQIKEYMVPFLKYISSIKLTIDQIFKKFDQKKDFILDTEELEQILCERVYYKDIIVKEFCEFLDNKFDGFLLLDEFEIMIRFWEQEKIDNKNLEFLMIQMKIVEKRWHKYWVISDKKESKKQKQIISQDIE